MIFNIFQFDDPLQFDDSLQFEDSIQLGGLRMPCAAAASTVCGGALCIAGGNATPRGVISLSLSPCGAHPVRMCARGVCGPRPGARTSVARSVCRHTAWLLMWQCPRRDHPAPCHETVCDCAQRFELCECAKSGGRSPRSQRAGAQCCARTSGPPPKSCVSGEAHDRAWTFLAQVARASMPLEHCQHG